MNYFENLFNPQPKKITVDKLLGLLTLSNSCFDKISKKVENKIFFSDIIDDDCPIEFQEENLVKKENFDNRFIVSSGITGIAILEYALSKKFGQSEYQSEIDELKKNVLPNLLKIREEILKDPTPDEFEFDTEYSLRNDLLIEEKFIKSVTQKAGDVERLISESGEYRNLYFHNYLALGQILPERNRIFFDPEFALMFKNKVIEIVELFNLYLDNI